MHENGALSAESDTEPAASSGGSGSGPTAATPMEYVSFLHGWFDMHEAKKVRRDSRAHLSIYYEGRVDDAGL